MHGHATLEEAKVALLAQWDAERRVRPEDSRIMLAHTRADVRDLNERARVLREAAGETFWGETVPTENGERRFSIGDQVLFGRNDRGLGVKNGTRGRVEWVGGSYDDTWLEITVPDAGGGSRIVMVRLAGVWAPRPQLRGDGAQDAGRDGGPGARAGDGRDGPTHGLRGADPAPGRGGAVLERG